MDPSRLAQVAALLPDGVERHYGADPRVGALRETLRCFADDTRAVDPEALGDLEAAAQTVFRHLELRHAEGLTAEEHSAGWPEEDIDGVTRTGAGIATVRRFETGVAVIRLTGLAPVAAAAPLLAGAFALVQGADRIVLDLRGNSGGDPATAALIVDWLSGGPPRHLFSVRYRDRVRQWWTAGAPLAEPPSGNVRALIGSGTYSSGEALAWSLQRERLAVLAGETTPGAADHVVPLALTHDVHALIPEACAMSPDGGPTWEGVGVQPDEPLSIEDLTPVE